VPGPTGPAGADSTVPGPTGPAGADSTVPGPTGPAGLTGEGVPAGGTTGQVLAKINATDYNTQWVTGGSDPWTYVKLETTVTSTSTANTATALAFGSLAADTHYIFEGMLFMQSSVTTTGVRPGISWPTGTTQETAWMQSSTSVTAFTSRFWGAPTTANAGATSAAVANEGQHGRFEGQFVTGGSPTGSLRITLASEIAASEVRLMANSWLRYRTI